MKRVALVALALAACRGAPSAPPPSHFVVVEARPEDALDLARARLTGDVKTVVVSGSTLTVELGGEPGAVVRVPGACPLVLSGATARATLTPFFDVHGEGAALGFDAPFDVELRPGCPEAARTEVTVRQVSGPPLRDVKVGEQGRRFSARTARLADLLGAPPAWGIVPLSPRTRGAVELEARYAGPDGETKRTIRLAAAARSRGLPNVATGTRLHLGGEGWHVLASPEGAKAAVETTSGAASLRPDVDGSWTLGDAQGKTLRLVAGKYDRTPLDCTRSDCHANIAVTARASPMATILARGLDAPFGGDYPACAGGCHSVGEPGEDDGGFFAVARELGHSPADLARTGWHSLPAPLRRLGGVGCLACHGPGAIPEASARHLVLRADVCATCHDAPPRYGHVAAWRSNRMARADADPRVTASDACARCHTTWGFLGRPDRRPPPGTEPAGIACAACHSVHPPSASAAPAAGRCEEALARKPDVPALLADAFGATAEKSRVCLSCHAPTAGEGSPSATASAIWLGRGGLDPRTGAAITGAAPDGALPGGCLGCHGGGPEGLERGSGHGFRATRSKVADRTIATRARALFDRIVAARIAKPDAGPPHASAPRFDLGTPEGRAAWDVALVLEDPAADVHNAGYARALLDAAEGVVRTTKQGGTAP